jgi:hypothetical protein
MNEPARYRGIDAHARATRLRRIEEAIAHADREHSPQECAEALAALQIDPLALQRSLDLAAD